METAKSPYEENLGMNCADGQPLCNFYVKRVLLCPMQPQDRLGLAARISSHMHRSNATNVGIPI
jgi:hypothetical protein